MKVEWQNRIERGWSRMFSDQNENVLKKVVSDNEKNEKVDECSEANEVIDSFLRLRSPLESY